MIALVLVVSASAFARSSQQEAAAWVAAWVAAWAAAWAASVVSRRGSGHRWHGSISGIGGIGSGVGSISGIGGISSGIGTSFSGVSRGFDVDNRGFNTGFINRGFDRDDFRFNNFGFSSFGGGFFPWWGAGYGVDPNTCYLNCVNSGQSPALCSQMCYSPY